MSNELRFDGLKSSSEENYAHDDGHHEPESTWGDFKSYDKKKKKKKNKEKKVKRLKRTNQKLKKKCKQLQEENSIMKNNNTYLEQRVSNIENLFKVICFQQPVENDNQIERKMLASVMTQGGRILL